MANVKTLPIQYAEVPSLDIDALMLRKFHRGVGATGTLERRIVWNLCLHLAANGWQLSHLDDGDENTKVSAAKEAMELLFNLDDAYVFFRNASGKEQWIRFVFGNGCDIVSDYSFSKSNNFGAVVEAFDSERCV